jgi:phospholipase C
MDSRIEHVIFMTPENRSYRHVFGYLENEDPNEKGIDAVSGSDGLFFDIAYGQTIINETLKKNPNIPEDKIRIHKQSFIDAQNKGIYDTNSFAKNKILISDKVLTGFTREDEYPIYHDLGRQFMVCNRWFSSIPSQTFPNRSFMLAATSNGRATNIPRAFYKGIYSAPTILNRLKDAGRSFKIYYDTFIDDLFNTRISSPDILKHAYHFDQLITDINENTLPHFSYVQLDVEDNSLDETIPYTSSVESYVGKVYNTLISNPEVWKKCIVFIIWDECGGFYDPILPPKCVPPEMEMKAEYIPSNTGQKEIFKFDRYGFRVPALIVSPYTLGGGINSTIYDHTSVIAFTEKLFHLKPLTLRDANANTDFFLNDTKLQPQPVKISDVMIVNNNHVDVRFEKFVTWFLVTFAKFTAWFLPF